MKLRLIGNTFLHIGTPWRGGVVSFEGPGVPDRTIRKMYGLASKRIGFIGWMKLS